MSRIQHVRLAEAAWSGLWELRRQNGWAKTFGLPMELLSAREAHDLVAFATVFSVEPCDWTLIIPRSPSHLAWSRNAA